MVVVFVDDVVVLKKKEVSCSYRLWVKLFKYSIK